MVVVITITTIITTTNKVLNYFYILYVVVGPVLLEVMPITHNPSIMVLLVYSVSWRRCRAGETNPGVKREGPAGLILTSGRTLAVPCTPYGEEKHECAAQQQFWLYDSYDLRSAFRMFCTYTIMKANNGTIQVEREIINIFTS